MKTKLGLLFLGMGLMITISCTKYPPESDRLLEDLAVITQYNTKAVFTDYTTYYIYDTITKITDIGASTISASDAAPAIQAIVKNMNARGYEQHTNVTDNVDMRIRVIYYQNTTAYTYSYSWYGGYYPYYPYYPVYYSSYTTGLADIELADMTSANIVNNQVPILWSAGIRGLLTGSHTTSEITGRIDQAFIQTPQLTRNK
jgi:hypothetical protein